jgi:hypothetical protein
MSKKACFEAAAKEFRDVSKILHPTYWEEACLKHGDLGFEPNNLERINLPWTAGDEMGLMFNLIMKKYKLSMRNRTKGTGGGPGVPEDYCHWEFRDATEYFLGYTTKFGCGLELRWIYMSDLALGLLLYSRFDGIPKEACLEDRIQPTSSPSKRAAEYATPNHRWDQWTR